MKNKRVEAVMSKFEEASKNRFANKGLKQPNTEYVYYVGEFNQDFVFGSPSYYDFKEVLMSSFLKKYPKCNFDTSFDFDWIENMGEMAIIYGNETKFKKGGGKVKPVFSVYKLDKEKSMDDEPLLVFKRFSASAFIEYDSIYLDTIKLN